MTNNYNLFIRFWALAIIPATVGYCLAQKESVLLRAENFTVNPSTGPVAYIVVGNTLDKRYEGTIRIKAPEGWEIEPVSQSVSLEARQVKRLPFRIITAIETEVNCYNFEIAAINENQTVVRKQAVFCTSAPYFKPKIDGNVSEWTDAIPVIFTYKGKKTVVRTYWNRRQFCLAVDVQEDKLVSFKKKLPAGGIDGVQFSLATADAVTGTLPGDTADRYEFLIADSAGLFAKDKCFKLLEPGDLLAPANQLPSLTNLEFNDVQIAVKRSGDVTRYECAIPFSALPTIKPATGREIRFSLLIHNPDGGGIRDFGQYAGLWETQRNPLAWRRWEGAKFSDYIPFDGKIEWGLCSSKH